MQCLLLLSLYKKKVLYLEVQLKQTLVDLCLVIQINKINHLCLVDKLKQVKVVFITLKIKVLSKVYLVARFSLVNKIKINKLVLQADYLHLKTKISNNLNNKTSNLYLELPKTIFLDVLTFKIKILVNHKITLQT